MSSKKQPPKPPGNSEDGSKPPGNPDKFDWIRDAIEQHEAPLLRYCRSLIGDVERSRDLVQETFVRLCRQDESEISDRLKNWLFKVCRNLAIDHLRREGKMQSTSVGEWEYEGPEMATRQKNPQEQSEVSDSFAHVMKFIGALPTNQQEVLRLKFQNSMSYKEISAVTGLTISHVGVLLHTALGTLRKKLNVGSEV